MKIHHEQELSSAIVACNECDGSVELVCNFKPKFDFIENDGCAEITHTFTTRTDK
jgi:hypothetical protein